MKVGIQLLNKIKLKNEIICFSIPIKLCFSRSSRYTLFLLTGTSKILLELNFHTFFQQCDSQNVFILFLSAIDY